MPRLQQPERHRAIGMLSAGASVRHVARTFNVNQTTISRHDVRTRPQMIVALRREWAAIPHNEIRAIIGLMRPGCAACMRADGGNTLIEHFVTFKMTPTLLFDDLQDVY